MNFLIDNAGFVNKGAELMLRSVIEKTKEKFPGRTCIVTPHSVGGIYSQAIGEGLYIYQKSKILKYLPEKLLKKVYFVKPSQVDMLLDAGGFQFGDQWAAMFTKESNERARSYYKTLKDGGAKLVFLPQAFGPFTNAHAIERMQIVFEYADILFAREKISYDYLIKLFGESPKIVLKPDFTNLIKPKVPLVQFIENKRYVCVVPNRKMISDTSKEVSEGYVAFLTQMCQFFIDQGEELILLNHEGKGDEDIINKIRPQLSKEVLMLTDLNALEVKAIIGKTKLLISSRFHGVVSGLSQGVCTFATGWSHKYPELLADYKVSENLLDIMDVETAKSKVGEALKNANSIHHVKPEVIKSLEAKSNEMWDQVWKLK
ncbi:polysaccharide pyruvyl transferase family protein [Flavobacterium subsaxonicum]|uniref:Polysaccharide pyruvyl transferase domain-containing protein n=1 Tax=Flavobacterium subsaxonicum WB 4.1-42 = DSM 21790 TaxID=1121898 RepID=A0A0A2MP55_9FLAO|nr:polysaccharide pyruvyl transferase family protein [Flavobacterium subsaxonicum]KGO93361.1 hypothetical protein Q766_08640 [Flavobacterium subsaxonicum WB 4.1-42 = DSM 21790]